ncbi:TonB-dependent receptor plug domain-containing protein [Niabella sp.]|uniref:TonB-dependent receptor plug domain-containing protein n=1 Tax=Niabella sp. TaxID=1962976 RepID=UPI00261D9C21|nr:TonB-dependent receptor plug domain-containing protein [Niabella sp.]
MRIKRFLRLEGFFLFVCFMTALGRLRAQDSTAASVNTEDSIVSFFDKPGGLYDSSVIAPRFRNSTINSAPMAFVLRQPYISIPQMIKGSLSGVYVQEPSGEPGTMANIFIHGIGAPLLTSRELFDQQAVVFIDGVPQIKRNPFVYEVQKYDFNPIGSATDVLALLNQDNIESIEVIKDPARLAILGPVAANGAIWVVTRQAEAKNIGINVNSYFGVVTTPKVNVTNAAYENNFRRTFYSRFGTAGSLQNYPAFLRDSTNTDYYGPSNWTDLYYKGTPVYSVDASVTAGVNRATLRAFVSALKNANSADETSLRRYTGGLSMNVTPFKWLAFDAKVDYDWLSRNRNKNITDRLAETRYIPNLSNPLPPNKSLYGAYLNAFNGAIDNNVNHVVNGMIGMHIRLNQLDYQGRLALNYGEEYRDAFWPTTLNEGNNFVSNFFGATQRLQVTNVLKYKFDLSDNNVITVSAGQEYYRDNYKFNYAYAYNTPNDFIKINVVNFDVNAADYLQSNSDKPFFFPSNMGTSLASFHGNVLWEANRFLKAHVLVRRDGSSTMQPGQKWFTGYGGAVDWDLKQTFLQDESLFSSLYITGGWSKLGKPFSDDRYSSGPQYRSDLGWSNEPTLGSFNGITGLTRPYNFGWIGYDIPWQYVNNLNAGLGMGLLQDRIKLLLEVYKRTDKNGLFAMPIPSEYGYTGAYKSGLEVGNQGLDLGVDATILAPQKHVIGWIFNANFNYNRNKLIALPGGVQEVVIGSNKFEVGKPVDQFWVYENTGTYKSASEIPSNLTYQGMPFQVGDAIWKDQNGDNVIDEKDKILKGNYLPKMSGGFGSSLTYKAVSLDFQFYMALGRKVLNQYASKRLDFINTEAANDIYSVKEITYWEKKVDLINYPVYNPWSAVIPYRSEQDLFLDNASFLKLKTVSIGFDFAKMQAVRTGVFKRAQVYVTGTNLLTITKFKGDDPELATYNGIYMGTGLPMPRSVILGLRLAF